MPDNQVIRPVDNGETTETTETTDSTTNPDDATQTATTGSSSKKVKRWEVGFFARSVETQTTTPPGGGTGPDYSE